MKPLIGPSTRQLLIPRRGLWSPRRRFSWRPRRFDTLNMAAGDLLLDSEGRVLLDSEGRRMLDNGSGTPCDCCHQYIQATGCGTDNPVDLWFARNSDGTIATEDGDKSLPFRFTKDDWVGVVYQVASTNPTSNTPGTLAVGITEAADCPDFTATCARCTGNFSSVTVTIADLEWCEEWGCRGFIGPPAGGYRYDQTGDPPNDTYDLQQISGCHWAGVFPSPVRWRFWTTASGDTCPDDPPTFEDETMTVDWLWESDGKQYVNVLQNGDGFANAIPNGQFFFGHATEGSQPCIGEYTVNDLGGFCDALGNPLTIGGVATVVIA